MISPITAALIIAALLAALPFLLIYWVTPKAPALVPVDEPQQATFPSGGIRFEDAGIGDTGIVLIHGFNGQIGAWNGVWPHLDGCGRRLRLDVPGFGGSRWNTRDYGLPEQAQRVIALLDQRGLRRVTLVGTSMGGSLAAWIAAHYPERVQRLALLAPSGYTGALRYSGLFGLIIGPGKLNAAATTIASSRLYQAAFSRSSALPALSVTASYGPVWVEALGRIRAPTLIVWSRGDEGVSYTTALDVRASIPGSTLLWLDEATDHLIPQARPELIAALACGLSQGALPAAAVGQVPSALLRAGEGIAP